MITPCFRQEQKHGETCWLCRAYWLWSWIGVSFVFGCDVVTMSHFGWCLDILIFSWHQNKLAWRSLLGLGGDIVKGSAHLEDARGHHAPSIVYSKFNLQNIFRYYKKKGLIIWSDSDSLQLLQQKIPHVFLQGFRLSNGGFMFAHGWWRCSSCLARFKGGLGQSWPKVVVFGAGFQQGRMDGMFSSDRVSVNLAWCFVFGGGGPYNFTLWISPNIIAL